MTTRKPSTAAPILAAVLILALPFAAYVVAYFRLGELWQSNGELHESRGDQDIVKLVPVSWERDYSTQWEAALFQPAAKVETWLRGIEVEVRARHH